MRSPDARCCAVHMHKNVTGSIEHLIIIVKVTISVPYMLCVVLECVIYSLVLVLEQEWCKCYKIAKYCLESKAEV